MSSLGHLTHCGFTFWGVSQTCTSALSLKPVETQARARGLRARHSERGACSLLQFCLSAHETSDFPEEPEVKGPSWQVIEAKVEWQVEEAGVHPVTAHTACVRGPMPVLLWRWPGFSPKSPCCLLGICPALSCSPEVEKVLMGLSSYLKKNKGRLSQQVQDRREGSRRVPEAAEPWG